MIWALSIFSCRNHVRSPHILIRCLSNHATMLSEDVTAIVTKRVTLAAPHRRQFWSESTDAPPKRV